MIGTCVQPRRPRITSTPSMPGRPRSRMTTSGCWRAASVERLLAGRGEVDVVAACAQVVAEGAADLRLVVDDEDRGSSPDAPRRPDDHRRAHRRACPRARSRRPSPRRTREPRRGRGRRRAVGLVAEPLEGLEHALALGRGGIPGPRSMTRMSTPSGRPRPRRPAPALRRRVTRTALAMMLASARSSSAGVGEDRRQRLGHVDVDRGPRAPRLASAAGTTSSSPTGARASSTRAGLQPAHVEQVADEGVEPVGLLVDRRRGTRRGLVGPVDVVLEEAGDRRLDRRQRRAQVVRHGGAERGPELVRLGRAWPAVAASASQRSSSATAASCAAKALRTPSILAASRDPRERRDVPASSIDDVGVVRVSPARSLPAALPPPTRRRAARSTAAPSSPKVAAGPSCVERPPRTANEPASAASASASARARRAFGGGAPRARRAR